MRPQHLWENDLIIASEPAHPLQKKNIVLGNLETGITGNSQFGATSVVRGVKQLEIVNRDDAGRCMIVENDDEAPIVALGPYHAVLFRGK